MKYRKAASILLPAVLFLFLRGTEVFPGSDKKPSGDTVYSELSYLPKPAGTYNIGRQFFLWADSSAAADEETGRRGRTLAVWIYYPSDIINSGSEAVLTDSIWRERHIPYIEKRYGKTASSVFSEIKTKAVTNSRPFRMQKGFPTLIFAPGYSWLPVDYSVIIENLVSRGFAVAAFAAPGVSSVVKKADSSFAETERLSDKTYLETAEDFIFIKNKICASAGSSSDPFFGVLSTNKIGVFGHSVGGAAAIIAASKDSTIRAACNLDGDYQGHLDKKPGQPILYITTQPFNLKDVPVDRWDEDKSEKRRNKVWNELKAGSKHPVRLKAEGMYHSNFQDAAIMPKELLTEEALEKRLGQIDGTYGLFMISDVISTFFKTEFAVEDTPAFSGVVGKYPELYLPAP